MMLIRAVIGDDEPLARERLRNLLASEADVEVVRECRHGNEILQAIQELNPDLLFLDVSMPELDGFGVLNRIPETKAPAVIFTTAYDTYAIRAFDANALDYLLKPFDETRFRKALGRAREHIAQGHKAKMNEQLVGILNDHGSERRSAERLVFKSGGRIVFIETEEIEWVEAAGNYVNVHVGKDSHLLRETMMMFESKLDPKRFLRIHRSIIVNCDRIREVQPCNGSEYVVVLKNGKELSLGRTYRDRIERLVSPMPQQGYQRD
jgi:two-component system, LytTR family, response regulator